MLGAFGCRQTDDAAASARRASRLRDELVSGTRLPDGLGAERAVVLLENPSTSSVQTFTRDLDADAVVPALELVEPFTLIAGLRTGVARADQRFECSAVSCWRAHGTILPSEALAANCRAYFEDLGRRLDGSALAGAFFALAVTPPPVPIDPGGRVAFASRGEGWRLSARDALHIAAALHDHVQPWREVFDEGLVPVGDAPGLLRGVTAGTTTDAGWFVGFTAGASLRFVVARVENCAMRCGSAAIRVARYVVEGRNGGAARDGDPGVGSSPGRRSP